MPVADKACLSKFACGESDIDNFALKLHKRVQQNRVRGFSVHEGAAAWGLGFYALSLTVEDKRKVGTRQALLYDFGVPLVYIDALGVRSAYQQNGIGRLLLVDALRRAHAVSQQVAIYGVALRSLNDRTTAFYESHGFGRIEETKHPLMVVPIWTLDDLFRS